MCQGMAAPGFSSTYWTMTPSPGMPTISSRSTSFALMRFACATTKLFENTTPAPKAAASAKPPRRNFRYIVSSLCRCSAVRREDYSGVTGGGKKREPLMHRTRGGELVVAIHRVGDRGGIKFNAVIALDQDGDTALARDLGGEIERLVDEAEFLVKTARLLLGRKLLHAGRTAIDPVHGDLFFSKF